jgi:hypothetical protein
VQGKQLAPALHGILGDGKMLPRAVIVTSETHGSAASSDGYEVSLVEMLGNDFEA